MNVNQMAREKLGAVGLAQSNFMELMGQSGFINTEKCLKDGNHQDIQNWLNSLCEVAASQAITNALWCAHYRGPDDMVAAPSYEYAVAMCDECNSYGDAVKAIPALWPYTPEEHAAELARGQHLPASEKAALDAAKAEGEAE